MTFSLLLADRGSVVRCVTFLEDRKIRSLPIADRVPLRTNNDQWLAACGAYLKAQDSTVAAPRGDSGVEEFVAAAVCWLVDKAIMCEYEDNGTPSLQLTRAGTLQSRAIAHTQLSRRMQPQPPAGPQQPYPTVAKVCTALLHAQKQLCDASAPNSAALDAARQVAGLLGIDADATTAVAVFQV